MHSGSSCPRVDICGGHIMVNVLVCIEMAILRESLVSVLQGAGYHAVGVADLASAWKALGQCSPQTIIFDIDMVREEGLLFLKNLREKDETKHIPVIL